MTLDYQDNREEELYQVDGTMEVKIPTDNSDDNEDNEPDNNAKDKGRHMLQLIKLEKI